MRKKLLLFMPLLFIGCGGDDEQTVQAPEPTPVVETQPEYPPFNLFKTSEEDFIKAFVDRTWSFCYRSYSVDEDGRWDRFWYMGNGGGELHASSDGKLEGTMHSDADYDYQYNVSSFFKYDETMQELSFPQESAPNCFILKGSNLKLISANEEYVVVSNYDEKKHTNLVYFLRNVGNDKHQPLTEKDTDILPTKRTALTTDGFLSIFLKYGWHDWDSYGIYADGSIGKWKEKDDRDRFFFMPDETTLKEFYKQGNKKMYRTCPFSYDETERCLVFAKDKIPTSFAGYSNKVYVLSVKNNSDTTGNVVFYEDASPQSGFKYVLHIMTFSMSKEDAANKARQYQTLDE
ncbi:MAG: hypothetical protein K6F20_07360 [Bacteroidaceae bacterium]|nr:hypothetical protein [Bacteroidaceae bacterium]